VQKPSFFRAKYAKAFDKSYVQKLNHIGKNTKGGFTHTPFGSSVYNSYWTIGGDTKNRFECGSLHENTGAYVPPDQDPNMIFTHHTIWFRGSPASEEEQRTRIASIVKK